MKWAHLTRRTEIAVAWVVAAGVALAGTYDVRQGVAPRGLFALDDDVRLGVLVAACALSAVVATVRLVLPPDRDRPWLRAVVMLVSVVPPVVADPTYGSLMLAVPLIDVRRRDDEPMRTTWTLAVVAVVALLLLGEDTPRVVAEVEATFGLAIAFFVIVMFGDALRQLDRGIVVQTELAQVAERTRLMSDLHDGVGHHLLATSVQIRKAQALRGKDGAAASRAVDLASQAIAEAISETRLVVDAGRSPRGFDVESAIRDLARRVVPSSTSITLALHGDHARLDTTTQVALYRVVQEALSNVVRHADAATTHVTSTVTPGGVHLEIVDDGAGFDVDAEPAAGGVQGMRRRIEHLGGSFVVTSVPGRTAVHATVPT